MFEVKPLDPPETVSLYNGAGSITLTHSCAVLAVDPRSQSQAVVHTLLKGYLNMDGRFVDWGDHETQAMDAEGLGELLADTTGGKPAGAFRTSDILPAIARRQAEKDAARAAKEAEDKAAREASEENKLITPKGV